VADPGVTSGSSFEALPVEAGYRRSGDEAGGRSTCIAVEPYDLGIADP
jgi:hypothetical protein